MFFGNVSRGKRGNSTYVPPPPPADLDATDWTIVGAPTVTHGATGVSSVNAALPVVSGGILAGDEIICYGSHKYQGTFLVPPAGNLWKRHKHSVHNNHGNGTNQGPTVASTLSKTAVGGESGTITFSIPEPDDDPPITSVNILSVVLMVIRRGIPVGGSPTPILDIQVFTATHRNFNSGALSSLSIAAKSINKIHLKAKDQILIFNSVNSSAFTFGTRNVTLNAALTKSDLNLALLSTANNDGGRQYIYASHHKILTGEATELVTCTATASGTATNDAPWVNTHIIRVRQVSETPEYVPGALEHLDPESIDTDQFDDNNGGWGVAKRDYSGTLSSTAGQGIQYGRALYNSQMHFYIKVGFANHATENNRRGEIHFSTWQPRFLPGVKLFESIRFRASYLADIGDQWIPWQHHTGTASGSPNHPAIAIEFCQANQYRNIQGWMFGTTYAPAGTMIVAISSSLTSAKYIAVPSINYIGSNKDIPLEIMLKLSYVAGQGRIIINSAGVNLIDETAYKIIAAQPAELGDHVNGSGIGSVAKVGGINKFCMYLHQIPVSGTGVPIAMKQYYDAYNNLGLTPEMRMYIRGIKRSIKHPNDFDYSDSYDTQTLQKMIIT